MAKVDLKGVRRISSAELKERHTKERKAYSLKRNKRRNTIVSSVSIPPELKIRIARDLGQGSFSKGVIFACAKVLAALDEDRAIARRALGDA